MCHMSHVMGHVSYVTFIINIYFILYLISLNFLYFSDKVVKLVGGGSVINRAYPVYFFFSWPDKMGLKVQLLHIKY